MSITLNEKAELCYNSAQNKKAIDVAMLDLRGISDVADVFLVASATSRTHAKTIVDEIEKNLRIAGMKTYHTEGYGSSRWTLVDAGDVVAHVFSREARDFYAIERLWVDSTEYEVASQELAR